MKTFMFAAALLMGGTAVAQPADAPQPPPEAQPDTGNTNPMPDGGNAQPDAGSAPEPMPQQPMESAPMQSQQAPMARPMASPGGDMTTAPSGATGFATRPATENYPACSRGVTDNCVQTNERGSRRGRRR